MSKDIDTPTVIRRELAARLPQAIQDKATELLVKKVIRLRTGLVLNGCVERMNQVKQELENITLEVDTLEVELRDMLEKHVNENNQ